MIARLVSRAPHLLLIIVILWALAPTPIPKIWLAPLKSAQVALAHHRYDRALDELESALAYDPQNPNLHLLAAQTALKGGEPARALQHLAPLHDRDETSQQADCLSLEATLRLDPNAGIAQILEAFPQDCPNAETTLDFVLETIDPASNPNATRTLLARLLEHRPLDPELRMLLGLYLAISDPPQAQAHLRLADDLTPGGHPLARRAFEASLDLAPDYVEARAYLGLALDQSGGNGIRELQTAVDVAPQAPLPRLFLAKHWNTFGEHNRALAELEIALAMAPESAAIHAELGATYAALGSVFEAEDAYLRAAELGDLDPTFWFLLAQFSLNYEVNISTIGLAAARRSITLAPQEPIGYDLLGYAHLVLGQPLLAHRMLKRALQLDPNNPSVHYHLGLFFLSQDDPTQAQTHLLRAAELDPQGRSGSLALRTLERLAAP